MVEIVLRLNRHPSETLETLDEKFVSHVVNHLQGLGHTVAVVPIPRALSNLVELKYPQKSDAIYRLEEKLFKKLLHDHPGAVFVELHHYVYMPEQRGVKKPEDFGFSKIYRERRSGLHMGFLSQIHYIDNNDDQRHYTVEIPALFKKTPEDEVARYPAESRRFSSDRFYIENRGDVDASRAAGLLSKGVAEKIAQGIHEKIVPEFLAAHKKQTPE